METIEEYANEKKRKDFLQHLKSKQSFRVSIGKNKWIDYEKFDPNYNQREILNDEVVIEFDTLNEKIAWYGTHLTCINLLNAGYDFELWEHGGKSPHIHIRDLNCGNLDPENRRMFKKLFIRKYVPEDYLKWVDYSLTGIHLIAMEWQFHWKGCYTYKTLLTKFCKEDSMGTISQEAKDYVPKTTKNIADLEIVSTDVDVQERIGTDSEGKDFTYKVVVINGEEYRVPLTVLASLKDILAKKPNLKSFSVIKSGTGLETRYTVIPQV